MEKKQEIKKIYKEAFNDTAEYVDMYFDKVYDDEEAMIYYAENSVPASSLFLKRYKMTFGDETVDIAYISAAATRRQFRDRGFMKTLIKEAIMKSRDRGDLFVTLIPAQKWLFDYYARFGFSTVFYVEELRYTSLHRFAYEGEYDFLDNPDTDEVYQAFDRMMRLRKNCVQHSRKDFSDIVADNKLDRGEIAVVRDPLSGMVVALAFGVMKDGCLMVKDVLADFPDAANAALSRLTARFPHVSVKVVNLPEDNTLMPLEQKAMARIVNVGEVLKVVARQNKSLKMNIRVTDDILPDNNHIYFIDNATCTVNDGYRGKLDIDVDIEVLTAILFSSGKVGAIFNLPTKRPFISLMLD